MINGFDSIIFACGPHCSGKTFNITGWNHKSEGIVHRLMEEIFTSPDHGSADAMSSAYAISCLEIKDNRVFDLLADNWKRPCLMKNVSKHHVSTVGDAKSKLWEAHSKRTTVAVRKDDISKWTARSHVNDYVVTIHRRASAPKDDDNNDTTATKEEPKCSKVHVVELAGIGPSSSKSLQHHIKANQTMLELGRFLGHVKDGRRDTAKYRGLSATTALLKYCQQSFSKQRTTLRVICHIRPELEFLNTNITILKLGEALRSVPSSEMSVPIGNQKTEPEDVELYKQMEHIKYELYLYKTIKKVQSMTHMTDEEYEVLRSKVLKFLNSEGDNDTILSKWSYAEGYTVMSVFREYYDRIMYAEEKPDNRLKIVPFALKSKLIDKNALEQTLEGAERAVKETKVPLFDDELSVKRKYWDEFEALNLLDFSEHKTMLADIQDDHRSFVKYSETVLAASEKLTLARDQMDKLRRKRHLSGNERYDRNNNVIVPAEEQRMFHIVKQADKEMMIAQNNFDRKQKSLNRMLFDYMKFKDTLLLRFEEYLNRNQTSSEITKEAKTVRISKSVESPSRIKKNSKTLSRKAVPKTVKYSPSLSGDSDDKSLNPV